ncbi:hypothetical protein POM88_018459 [Heracleum sosnowskyi]|uniref:FAR1 domain-containing protein n=1 Tax=Heracleum sosnowskyi TaxID=360622 RepID=A0AAD8IT01_9APIA|nr:hypothetical protein POM88_018459 [Heracleum sosnowskyi]
MTGDGQISGNSLSDELQNTDDNDLNVESSTKTSFVPREGLQFQTHEEAYDFYNNFSLTDGFAIRRYYTYKSINNDVIIRRTFVCNKEGFKKKDENNEKDVKRRRESRCGCKASMEIVLNRSGSWEIKKFCYSH